MSHRLPVLALTALVALVAPTAPVIAGPASAADCPAYSGCPLTYTLIKAPATVERGERARIKVKVGSDGNFAPQGRVTLVVVRAMGGFKWEDNKKYRGKPVAFRTPTLTKRGKYVVKARFDAKPGSIAKDSDNRARFRVVRRG